MKGENRAITSLSPPSYKPSIVPTGRDLNLTRGYSISFLFFFVSFSSREHPLTRNTFPASELSRAESYGSAMVGGTRLGEIGSLSEILVRFWGRTGQVMESKFRSGFTRSYFALAPPILFLLV